MKTTNTQNEPNRFFIGCLNALWMSLILWGLICWGASIALATPPDNRPPDNRPPSGDAANSITSNIESTVNSNFSGEASAVIEGGAVTVDHGDTSTKFDSKSLALMNTMGDVDINDCRESEQFGTPIFSRQWIALNPWCAAEVYDAKGLNELAARTRCTIKEIKRLFKTDAECVIANTVQAPAPPPAAPVEHDRDDELERRLEINQAYTAELESRLADLETLVQRAPARQTQTVVRQVPFLSDEKRAALEQLRNE